MTKYMILCKSTPTEVTVRATGDFHKPYCALIGSHYFLHTSDNLAGNDFFGLTFDETTPESLSRKIPMGYKLYYSYSRKCDAVRIMNWYVEKNFDAGRWDTEYSIVPVEV